MLSVLAAVAEFERELVRERVREGLVNARRKGARPGRPPALERQEVARRWPNVRRQLEAGALSKRAAAQRLRIGYATLERLLARDSSEIAS